MFSLAPEGKRVILAFFLLSILLSLWFPWLSLPAWGFFVALLYFFRDPERFPPLEEGAVVSPADGRIIDISEAFENKFLKDRANRVSIFMSLFDVHVNRSPIEGKVLFRDYLRGAKRMAFGAKSSLDNERSFVGIQGDIPVLLVQVAGFVARRIVTYPKVGDFLKKGERLGIIKFGSRVDLYLPTCVELSVKVGDKVRAGETVLGVIKKDEEGKMAELSDER